MASNRELQTQVTALRQENDDLKKQLQEGGSAEASHTEVQQLKEELEATRGLLVRADETSQAMQAEWERIEAEWKEQFERLDAIEPGPVSSAPHLFAGEAVVLRRPARVGDRQCEPGERLGVVILDSGVSLNFLVDAIRNDLAKGEAFSVDEEGLGDGD